MYQCYLMAGSGLQPRFIRSVRLLYYGYKIAVVLNLPFKSLTYTSTWN